MLNRLPSMMLRTLAGAALAFIIAMSAAPVLRGAETPASAPTLSTPATPGAAASPAVQTGATAPALQAEVVGLRNDHGRVGCSLFNDPVAFPRDDSKIFRHVWAPIRGGRALCEFKDIPAGEYALVVFHDENNDGEFNENVFGMPLEGYGFSRDAAALFDAPSFAAARFHYDGKRLYQVITIRY
jgi:uncharacterized protein (DUF2141 family)